MGKTYFITGASSGFGEAWAEAVLERGNQAVLGAPRIKALERIALPHGDAALALELDVTDPEARRRAIEAALERFGRVDVLANIAGRGSLGAAEEFSPEQLREQMELNFLAAAEMTRDRGVSQRQQCKQPGDPKKAAEAMIRVVESESPPLRLLLGSDALGLREKKFGELQGEIAAWRAVGEATAFDGAEVVPVGG